MSSQPHRDREEAPLQRRGCVFFRSVFWETRMSSYFRTVCPRRITKPSSPGRRHEPLGKKSFSQLLTHGHRKFLMQRLEGLTAQELTELFLDSLYQDLRNRFPEDSVILAAMVRFCKQNCKIVALPTA